MSRANLSTVVVLIRRELLLDGRRVALGLLAPAVAWSAWALLAFGSSPASTAATGAVTLLGGVVTLSAVLAAVIANAERGDDRQGGFLRLVQVGPATPSASAIGTTLGVAVLGLGSSATLLAAAPLAGLSFAHLHWPLLLGAWLLLNTMAAAATTALAFVCRREMTYWLAAGSGALLLWLGAGAITPLCDATWVEWSARLNPMAQAVTTLAWALHGTLPEDGAWAWPLGGLVLWTAGGITLATWAAHRFED